MSEPGAGSDLAGIRTSAIRDGDDGILNGANAFISAGANPRLPVVITAFAAARQTWRIASQYAMDRKAFGQSIGSFQHSRLVMAELDTEPDIADQLIGRRPRPLGMNHDPDRAKWPTQFGVRSQEVSR